MVVMKLRAQLIGFIRTFPITTGLSIIFFGTDTGGPSVDWRSQPSHSRHHAQRGQQSREPIHHWHLRRGATLSYYRGTQSSEIVFVIKYVLNRLMR